MSSNICCAKLVQESGNDRERHVVSEIIAREQTFINSTSPEKIQQVTDELGRLEFGILMRTPDFLNAMFVHLVDRRASMNDQIQASQLIDSGKRAAARGDIEELRLINGRLWDLMPAREQASDGTPTTYIWPEWPPDAKMKYGSNSPGGTNVFSAPSAQLTV